MVTERTVPPLLPFVAAQPLTDHHCHGVLRSGGDVEALLNEADGAAAGGGLAFDSLAGLAFRRWCPPLVDLPAHATAEDYQARRDALGAAEVARRFLGECGLGALCMDTGYAPGGLLSPAETAGLAGAAAFEIVRLEQVAETLAAAGTGPAGFADAYRAALAERVASPAS
ncbi:MAG TPA: amidohydrolase, partial [Trebonia sp.]|nr:amidohydrolase [Trebonia sp.]